ncbi:MAG: hypothetical protein KF858_03165 [Candidatus Sumerlaeia bacterium]|nr:hypothetical protein [Candidatus Sumerlaeia bacterium]
MSDKACDTQVLASWPGGVVVAGAVTAALAGLLTVAKDLIAPIKAAFAALAGHHWRGQTLVLLVLFIVLAFACDRLRVAERWRLSPCRAGMLLLAGSAVGVVSIVAVFVLAG